MITQDEATADATGAADPLLSPETSYPGLRWLESGLQQLAEVRRATDPLTATNADSNDDRLALLREVREELHRRLTYLSEYGGDGWQVHIWKDWAPLSFSLFWHQQVAGEWRPRFNGGLQCNAVAQPLGASVVIGAPCYWSIHT